eukprot:TRINITY_DN63138_c0_g2_i1.p1 TRINITY_DN63138_c0_g2~~TRINITY_DN63138_c0_g2_i1.p1  ORF type:complete len:1011 (+),score=143.08 TRINITY_DN63138_c0_g2_i1:301-3033(+)
MNGPTPVWQSLHKCYRYCYSRELLNKANVDGCVEGARIPHGGRCTVKCKTGFVGRALTAAPGGDTKNLGKPLCYDGTWIGEQISCVVPTPPPCCKWTDIPFPLHAMPFPECDDCYKVGYQMKLKCLEGFALDPVGSTVRCSEDGTWVFTKGIEAKCSPTCPPLNVPNAAGIDMCPGTQPGGTCVFECKEGFTPVWKDWNNDKKWDYGPLCAPDLKWKFVPDCREQCNDASKCAKDRLCDRVCAIDEGSRDCGGPSCDWDSKTCDPIEGSISILPLSFKIAYHASKPLPSTAWVGIFNKGEADNFLWAGEEHNISTSTGGERLISVAANVVNQWRGGGLEARLFADAGNKKPIAKATLCESLEKYNVPVDLSSGKRDVGTAVTGLSGCSGVAHDCKDGETIRVYGYGFNKLLATSNVVTFVAGHGSGLKDDGTGDAPFCRDLSVVPGNSLGPDQLVCVLTVPSSSQGTWLTNVRVNGTLLDGNPTLHIAALSVCGRQVAKCTSRCEKECTKDGKCGMGEFACNVNGVIPACTCVNGVKPIISDTQSPSTPGPRPSGPISAACVNKRAGDSCDDGQALTAIDRCVASAAGGLFCTGTKFRSSVIVVRVPGTVANFKQNTFRAQIANFLTINSGDIVILDMKDVNNPTTAAKKAKMEILQQDLVEVAFQFTADDVLKASQLVSAAVSSIMRGDWQPTVPSQSPDVFDFDRFDLTSAPTPVRTPIPTNVPTAPTAPKPPTAPTVKPPSHSPESPTKHTPETPSKTPTSHGGTTGTTPTTNNSSEDDGSLAAGYIALIVIGGLLGLGAIIGVFVMLNKNGKKKAARAAAARNKANPLANTYTAPSPTAYSDGSPLQYGASGMSYASDTQYVYDQGYDPSGYGMDLGSAYYYPPEGSPPAGMYNGGYDGYEGGYGY